MTADQEPRADMSRIEEAQKPVMAALLEVLGDLIDALSDDLQHEVSHSSEVRERILLALPFLGPEYQSYAKAWWLGGDQ